jgi:hypothetical protein
MLDQWPSARGVVVRPFGLCRGRQVDNPQIGTESAVYIRPMLIRPLFRRCWTSNLGLMAQTVWTHQANSSHFGGTATLALTR